jgi:hypothetical protein
MDCIIRSAFSYVAAVLIGGSLGMPEDERRYRPRQAAI